MITSGFDKAAILYDVNDDYALGLKDNFVKVFESKGGTIVAEEGYTAGDTDFTAQLTKIKEAQPQIIFTPIFYQDFIMTTSRPAPSALRCRCSAATAARPRSSSTPPTRWTAPTSSTTFPSSIPRRRLPQGVCREVQRREDGAQRLHGARRVLLWCAAVEKAGSDDPQAIADAYSQVEVEGMAGKIKISAEDHNPVGKSGCVERIDGKNKTYVFETYIAAD